ncbi:MAG: serine hydrolase [Clostridiales bacterium]|nr:serine hydrolase [Clostridiales bacterium]
MQKNSLLEATPEEVDYDSSRISVLKRHLQKLVDDNTIMGSSYCIARKNKLIACDAVGYKHYKKLEDWKMEYDTVMKAASVTKLFTAVAVFQLVEDGLLRLDEPMAKYIPQMDFDPFREITIANVLTHTSGMWPDGGCFPNEKYVDYWEKIDECKPGDDWIKAAMTCGVRRRPNEEWMYCSFGYVMLGVLISNVSGEFAEDYIMNHIVKPLGMTNTAFHPTKEMFLKHLIYEPSDEEFVKKYGKAIVEGLAMEEEATIWNEVPNTGGGLHTTVTDLIKFGQMLCNGGRYQGVRILGRMSIEKMSEQRLIHIPNYTWGSKDQERLYGLGPDLRRGDAIITSDKFFFHEGAGALCVAIDPKVELTAAWFVPYMNRESWFPECLLNVKNIIWSGIM